MLIMVMMSFRGNSTEFKVIGRDSLRYRHEWFWGNILNSGRFRSPFSRLGGCHFSPMRCVRKFFWKTCWLWWRFDWSRCVGASSKCMVDWFMKIWRSWFLLTSHFTSWFLYFRVTVTASTVAAGRYFYRREEGRRAKMTDPNTQDHQENFPMKLAFFAFCFCIFTLDTVKGPRSAVGPQTTWENCRICAVSIQDILLNRLYCTFNLEWPWYFSSKSHKQGKHVDSCLIWRSY